MEKRISAKSVFRTHLDQWNIMDPGSHSQSPTVFVKGTQMIGKGAPSFCVQIPPHPFKLLPYSFVLMTKKSAMNCPYLAILLQIPERWQFYWAQNHFNVLPFCSYATQTWMYLSCSCKYNKNQGHTELCCLVYFFCNTGIYILSESMANVFVLLSFFSYRHNSRGLMGNWLWGYFSF